ncbi:ImmA/IrrE family metallo-endopeptidase [Paenibacillus sp. IB182496]|uniref:ImmA/IrrE family metallo-endopeptidase n=1 Tax=Paenibacillus sabuli TaxID=2772509 RepID=A0A927GSN0_9BACL|nr:ImmA/IrrE family metallo-endopeptidase [Paenibacillus sabuli]MBD2846195.1 ImmA/IrrE family metallo-endopeptidase [Paenibacillus sabuli]
MIDIKRRTRNLHAKYGTSDPFKLAACLNVTVLHLELPQSVKGYCQRLLRRKFIIINAQLEEEEQRFICAHELGHIVLHKGVNHYFVQKETNFVIGKFERQANEFAVKLLAVGERMEHGEQLESFLLRCGVPRDMHAYYL